MTQETDSWGTWNVQVQKNGVKIRELITPSQFYKDHTKPPEPIKFFNVDKLAEVLIAKGIIEKKEDIETNTTGVIENGL